MAGVYYNENQRKATLVYRQSRSQINMNVTKEQKQIIQDRAKELGLSINQYMLDLAMKDCGKE